MIAAFHAELRKLLRPRVALGTGGLMAALAVLATTLAFLTASKTPSAFGEGRPGEVALSLSDLARADGATRGFVIGAGFAGVVVLVMFAVSVASEFSTGTIRNLLIFEPRRPRVIGGKLLALFVFAAAGFLVAEVVAIGTAAIIAQARGIPMHDWLTAAGARSAISAYGSTMLAAVGWGVLGASVALLVRSVPVALAIALAWVFPLENILFRSWSGAGRWFPGLLLQGVSAGTGGTLGWTRALVTVSLYLATFLAVAGVSFTRRDVTA